MQVAFVLPPSMLLLVPVGLYRLNWFFHLVGAHYLPFATLYGMRMFLAGILVATGIVIAVYFAEPWWHEESASADDLRAPLGEYSQMRCAGKPVGRVCEGGGARWRPLSNTRGFLASSDRNVAFGALDDLRE